MMFDSLKAGKAASGDKIRPEMLKALNRKETPQFSVFECVKWHGNVVRRQRTGERFASLP